jgi:phosphomannomutase/phosphoglucomutase
MNPHIFREYDIRGIAETDLTDDVTEKIGLALGTLLQGERGTELVVGRDVRLSSERLSTAIIRGLTQSGHRVVDVGVVPTPVLYFSLHLYRAAGGVMVTGSHNPKEYNGFKLCRGKSTIYGDAIQQLRRLIEKNDFARGFGPVRKEDAVPAYVQAIKDRIKLRSSLKIVIDPGNGTAGPIARDLFTALGMDVECIHCTPDGNFPNHLPDPTVEEYMEDLVARLKETRADVGIGYDGDGDRIGVVDDKGRTIWGDRLLGVFSKEVLRRNPGSKIIFDVKCSEGLVEFIRQQGGTPVMWKTGHSLIKAKMKEEDSPLAGEMSGHIFFADDYYGYDDAIYASARLLEIMTKTSLSLSELAAEIPFYHATPEIRVECEDEKKFDVVEKLKSHFTKDYEVIALDGVRVIFDGGWGLVRASNTQPVLVLRFEAKSQEKLAEIRGIVLAQLEQLGIRN